MSVNVILIVGAYRRVKKCALTRDTSFVIQETKTALKKEKVFLGLRHREYNNMENLSSATFVVSINTDSYLTESFFHIL